MIVTTFQYIEAVAQLVILKSQAHLGRRVDQLISTQMAKSGLKAVRSLHLGDPGVSCATASIYP